MDEAREDRIREAFAELEEKRSLKGRIREFVDRAVAYHGFPAPGVVLGAYMVDLALEKLDPAPGERLYAVAETRKCLSDSIGVLTGCTPGSHRFVLFNTGRLSLAIGREAGDALEGVRAFVVHGRTLAYPALSAWYFNDRCAGFKEDLPALLDDILRAGRDILSWERVEMPLPPRDDDWEPYICPGCGEMLPDKYAVDGLCRACGPESCYAGRRKKK